MLFCNRAIVLFSMLMTLKNIHVLVVFLNGIRVGGMRHFPSNFQKYVTYWVLLIDMVKISTSLLYRKDLFFINQELFGNLIIMGHVK